jgi:hypothetical protein
MGNLSRAKRIALMDGHADEMSGGDYAISFITIYTLLPTAQLFHYSTPSSAFSLLDSARISGLLALALAESVTVSDKDWVISEFSSLFDHLWSFYLAMSFNRLHCSITFDGSWNSTMVPRFSGILENATASETFLEYSLNNGGGSSKLYPDDGFLVAYSCSAWILLAVLA